MFNSYGTDPSLGIDARKSVQGATGTSEGNISIPEYQIILMIQLIFVKLQKQERLSLMVLQLVKVLQVIALNM